jgi:hypothetical protein
MTYTPITPAIAHLPEVQQRMVASQVSRAINYHVDLTTASPKTKAHAVAQAHYDAHAEALHALLSILGANVSAAPFGLYLDLDCILGTLGPRPIAGTARRGPWTDAAIAAIVRIWWTNAA